MSPLHDEETHPSTAIPSAEAIPKTSLLAKITFFSFVLFRAAVYFISFVASTVSALGITSHESDHDSLPFYIDLLLVFAQTEEDGEGRKGQPSPSRIGARGEWSTKSE